MPIEKWLCEATIYSLALIFIILVARIIHPRLWLKDYPESIRLVAAPMSRSERLVKRLIDFPLVIIKVGYPVFSGFVYKAAMGSTFNLWFGFVHLLVLYGMYVLIDLFLFDGLIFCLITPGFIVIDGTQELKSAYKDFAFHVRKALSELGISVVFSAFVIGALAV